MATILLHEVRGSGKSPKSNGSSPQNKTLTAREIVENAGAEENKVNYAVIPMAFVNRKALAWRDLFCNRGVVNMAWYCLDNRQLPSCVSVVRGFGAGDFGQLGRMYVGLGGGRTRSLEQRFPIYNSVL